MAEWRVYIQEINTLSIILRLTIITVISGIIGIERGRKGRPAGFRTHMLVGIGSTMVMLTGQYMVEGLQMGTDASRLGAQVISGIGFLGAGTIIVIGRNQVKGLTTAAGLWACACMGLAVGIGFYEGAIIGGLFLFFVMMGLHRLDEYVRVNSRVIELYMELDDMSTLTHMIENIKSEGSKISNLEIHKIKQDGEQSVGALMTLNISKKYDHSTYVLHLHDLEGVRAIEEII